MVDSTTGAFIRFPDERDASFWDFGDAQSHGTHVAGLTSALGDNGLGVAGVAWRVQRRQRQGAVLRGGAGRRSLAADAGEELGLALRTGAAPAMVMLAPRPATSGAAAHVPRV